MSPVAGRARDTLPLRPPAGGARHRERPPPVRLPGTHPRTPAGLLHSLSRLAVDGHVCPLNEVNWYYSRRLFRSFIAAKNRAPSEQLCVPPPFYPPSGQVEGVSRHRVASNPRVSIQSFCVVSRNIKNIGQPIPRASRLHGAYAGAQLTSSMVVSELHRAYTIMHKVDGVGTVNKRVQL